MPPIATAPLAINHRLRRAVPPEPEPDFGTWWSFSAPFGACATPQPRQKASLAPFGLPQLGQKPALESDVMIAPLPTSQEYDPEPATGATFKSRDLWGDRSETNSDARKVSPSSKGSYSVH